MKGGFLMFDEIFLYHEESDMWERYTLTGSINPKELKERRENGEELLVVRISK